MTELAVYKHTFLISKRMEEQITNEEVVEEVTTEENTPEDNVDETTEEETEEITEESTDDNIDWEARALKAERAIEKAKKKGKTEKREEVSDPEEIARLKLKVEGVKEDEDIDYVLRVAKAEGVDAVEAAGLDFVKDKLSHNKRQRASAQATPRSNNRTNTQADEVSVWVKKYQKDGSVPDDPALAAKVLDALKN